MKSLSAIVLSLSIIFPFFIAGCKTVKPNYPWLKEFKIGQSGGFTGASEEYFITSDGRILLRDYTRGTDKVLGKFPRKTAKEVFSKFDALALSEIEMNQPYNMSYYLEMNIFGKQHRILWGDPKSPPPGNIGPFYEYCWGLIKMHISK
jgi:hypothetical protein